MTAKASDDGRRDGDGGDERRAEVAQEDEDDDGGEDAAEDEVLLDGGERGPDELGVVADEDDLDVGRQRLLDLGHARLDGVGQRDRVDAALLAHGDGQGRPAVEHRDRRRVLARIDDLADVADANRRVPARGDDEVVEGVRAAQASDGADGELAVALLETAAGQLQVLRAQGGGDVGRREAVGVEAIGVDLDLDLAPPRAEEQHFADAVDRLEPLLHVLLEKRRQLDDRHRRRHREHQDRERIRILFLHDRRIRGVGQIADDRIDLGADLLRRDVGVLRQVERDRDARAALGRGRAQLVDARDRVDRGFDAVGDLGLHVLRRRAGVGGRDRDDRRLDPRVAVDPEREERHPADDRDGGNQHRGEDGTMDADFSELLHGEGLLR